MFILISKYVAYKTHDSYVEGQGHIKDDNFANNCLFACYFAEMLDPISKHVTCKVNVTHQYLR